jgi:hypothetical protein
MSRRLASPVALNVTPGGILYVLQQTPLLASIDNLLCVAPSVVGGIVPCL